MPFQLCNRHWKSAPAREIVPAEEKESPVDDTEEAEAKIMLDRLYRLKAERMRTIKASNNHPVFSPAGKRGKKRRK